jgi:acyl-CoA thioesterase-1
MPLGASITAGLSVNQGVHTFEGGYRKPLEALLEPALQAKNLDFDFVGSQIDPPTAQIKRNHHEGHPGWRTDSIDEHAAEWIQASQPDVVLLLVGTNDILQNFDLQNAPARLNQLVTDILATSPVKFVFVSSILPLGDPVLDAEAKTYNAAIADLMLTRQHGGEHIIWVDQYADSGITAQDLGDGIHPNAPGYAKLAQLWFQAMAPLLN